MGCTYNTAAKWNCSLLPPPIFMGTHGTHGTTTTIVAFSSIPLLPSLQRQEMPRDDLMFVLKEETPQNGKRGGLMQR